MKSVPVAIVLGSVLGPLGLVYVGLGHAAGAFAGAAIVALVSGAPLLVPFWIACGVWGGVAASRARSGWPGTPLYRPILAARSPVTVKLPSLGSGPEGSGIFCLACGAHLPVSTRFCNRCGASTGGA